MSVRGWLAAGALFVAATMLTGCGNAGDLTFTNESDVDVLVLIGDEPDITVSGSGGAVLLDYGCTPGDVTVEFPSGTKIVLTGPVCPGQEVVIGDETAEVRPPVLESTS